MVRALAGWTIGVTADRRADEQQELLRRAGAAVVRGPTIRTLLLGADRTIRLALDAIVERPPEIAVLTTGIGTRTLFEVADSLGMADAVLEALSGSAVFARGPKASGAAQTAGLEVTWQAPTATSRELVDHLEHVGVYGRRIAVQLDGRARPVLGDELRGLGAEVVDVPVYRWTLPEQPDSARRLVDAVCAGRVDAVTFTSSPALWNIVELAGDQREALLKALRGEVATISVGTVCTSSARALGIEPRVEPQRARLGAMVHALSSFAERENARRTVVIGDVRVTLHACTAVIDGDVIEVTDRERAVLQRLLARPGTVVSKAMLLHELWPRGTDVHVAEVAVSRLRRRLGGRLRISVVPQRGYVLTGV